MAVGLVEVLLFFSFVVTCYYGFRLYSKKPQGFGEAQASSGQDVPKVESEPKEASNLLPLTIFYGSQSGTAEGFATEVQAEAKAYGFKAQAVDLEDYEPEDLPEETFALFLMATFGEGEPTDNAVQFWEWITDSDREDESMENVNFAVFGLGNRQYEHFCTIGIKLDKMMGKYGGKRICEHGEGDDDGTLDEDFAEWKKQFWPAAREHFGLAKMEAVTVKFEPTFSYEVVANDLRNATGRYANYDTARALRQDPKNRPVMAPVVATRELLQDTSGGSTIHMDLDISEIPQLRYNTADNMGVIPRNDFKQAGYLIKRLGGSANSLFTMRKPGKFMFPSPCSLQDAFLYFLDFNNVPRNALLQTLSSYAESPDEKEQLERFVNDEGEKEAFHADQMSLFEVLEKFQSVKPPMSHFLEFCPKLQPRYYTVSSSSIKDKDTVSMTLSLLVADKPRNRVHKGVVTHQLCAAKAGSKVPVFVRPSTFRLPRDVSSVPIIMCGPGTGIAPFKGFIDEFTYLKETKDLDVDATLYFGCRRRDEDYLYKDELEAAKDAGVLSELHVAFSREQEEKVYVQHLMEQHSEQLWEKIDKSGAYFYVCGATTMGRAIREVLVSTAVNHGGKSKEAAEAYVAKMQKDNRFVQELWS